MNQIAAVEMESYELRFSPWFLCTLEEMEHDADLPTIHAAVDRMFRNHEIALQCILLQQKGDLALERVDASKSDAERANALACALSPRARSKDVVSAIKKPCAR